MMKRIERRDFLKSAAAAAGGLTLGAGGLALNRSDAFSQEAPGAQTQQYRLFSYHSLPTPRPARNVERLFQTPFPAANGMQASDAGLWMVDGQTRTPEGERTSHVYLLSFDGEVLRDFPTAGETPSGMTYDGESVWIAATYSEEIIQADANTGETVGRYFTPGAGVIYRMPGDPSARRSPLSPPPRPEPEPAPQPRATSSPQGGSPPEGSHPGTFREGTGGHGMEYKDGKLWLATPPSRMIYRINPETWMVEHQFPSVHKRPHGIGFEGDYLWESDADVATFYKRDPESGVVIEAIRLSDDDPIPHGVSVWDGYIWWVDDVVGNSWVSRMPI